MVEERVLAGLKDRLMAPEAAAEAMRAWAEETNRINRERHASGASDRKELAQVEKKIAAMIAVIEDGGYVRGMVDRLRELEACQDELNERLSAAPADLPDIHPTLRTSTGARWRGVPRRWTIRRTAMRQRRQFGV